MNKLKGRRGGEAGMTNQEAVRILNEQRNKFMDEESYMEQYYANEMVKPTKCPCGELFDAKDSSFCSKCGGAYGELSGRYTNIGR